jgi:hypothetical protein
MPSIPPSQLTLSCLSSTHSCSTHTSDIPQQRASSPRIHAVIRKQAKEQGCKPTEVAKYQLWAVDKAHEQERSSTTGDEWSGEDEESDVKAPHVYSVGMNVENKRALLGHADGEKRKWFFHVADKMQE